MSCAAVPPAFSDGSHSVAFGSHGSGLHRSASDSDPGPLSAFELEHELDLDLALAIGDGSAPNDPPYADLRYRLTAETVRADGLRWGGRLELGAVRHDGGRGAGGLIACAQDCGLRGLATGLHTAPGYGPAEARAGVHRAELYVRHPYFELRAGVTETAAVLERPAAPRALRLSRADGPLADPFAFNVADTALSLTAPTAGISVQSRRLAGFRAAASYSIDADPCGLDLCRPGAGLGPQTGEIWAAAVSFDRRRPATGVRWSAYAGGEVGALDGVPTAPYADPWTGGLALMREEGPVTLSARWLTSNDGLGSGRYDATAVAAAYEAGDWLYSLEMALGESGAFETRSSALFFGASRFVGRNGLAGAGVQIVTSESGPGAAVDRAALVLEAGLRF